MIKFLLIIALRDLKRNLFFIKLLCFAHPLLFESYVPCDLGLSREIP